MIIDTPWMPNVLGGGDVAGPASATDNAVARFDGTTGKLIQNSTVTIADSTGAIAGASSLTSPASTNLTLGTTDSGAAITVLSASKNVGIGTIAPAQLLHVYSTGTVQPVIEGGLAGGWPILEIKHGAGSRWLIENGRTAGMLGFFNATNGGQRAGFTDAGNLLIGTTDETGLTGAGGLKINSTTAASANAGALVLAGGISAGNSSVASYFGGAVTAAGTGAFGGSGSLSSTYLSRLSVFAAGGGNFSVGGQTNTNNTVVARMTAYNASNGNSGNESSTAFMGIASIESVVKTATGNAATDSGGDLVFLTKGDGGTLTERMRLLSTGAATFAGAVAIGNTVGAAVAVASTHKVTVVIGGITYYLLATNVP